MNCPVCATPIPDATVARAAAQMAARKAKRHGPEGKRVTYANVTGTVREICAALNINRYQLARRIAKQPRPGAGVSDEK